MSDLNRRGLFSRTGCQKKKKKKIRRASSRCSPVRSQQSRGNHCQGMVSHFFFKKKRLSSSTVVRRSIESTADSHQQCGFFGGNRENRVLWTKDLPQLIQHNSYMFNLITWLSCYAKCEALKVPEVKVPSFCIAHSRSSRTGWIFKKLSWLNHQCQRLKAALKEGK